MRHLTFLLIFLIVSNLSFTQTSKTEPFIFETAFVDTAINYQESNEYELKKLDIGMINIESGRIIACDPIVMNNRPAFTHTFPIGEFPVQLAIKKTNNDIRVAFSRILFSYNDVTKWEFALIPGQKKVDILDSVFYCFSVDAGLALFIDEQANIKFNKKGHSKWKKVFVDIAMQRNFGYIYHFGKHNLAFFPSGYGDGCYATYIGFDENGKICRLLIDFSLIEWWK